MAILANAPQALFNVSLIVEGRHKDHVCFIQSINCFKHIFTVIDNYQFTVSLGIRVHFDLWVFTVNVYLKVRFCIDYW